MTAGQSHTDEWAVSMARYFDSVRSREFPWTAERIYLNNASQGPLPLTTYRAIQSFLERRTRPYELPDSYLVEVVTKARESVADFLGAAVEEIALVPNTTLGLWACAASLPLKPGDRVLLPDGEFPANAYPWLELKERGIEVELIPALENGWPDEERLLDRVESGGIRAVAVSHVQFSNGYRVDLAELGGICRRKESFLVVDAIQSLGQVPLDVSRVPVDMLAAGAQKWLLGPWGAGFMYVRRELAERLRPAFPGWLSYRASMDVRSLTRYDLALLPDARRFEMGTLPFQDVVGMTESLGLIGDLGLERIADFTRRLRDPLVQLAETGAISITSPVDRKHGSAIVCVMTSDTPSAYERLTREGVVCSFREGAIRLSPHFYNSPGEMERVADILLSG